MIITSEHPRTRVASGSVRIVQRKAHGSERAKHIKHISYQQSLRNRRMRIIHNSGWDKEKFMELLTQEPTYGANRGRGVVESGINVENILNGLDVETFEEAVAMVIELGSPFLALSKSDGDWYGSRSKIKKLLQAEVEEHGIRGVKVAERVTKDTNLVKLTFRQAPETDTEEE